MEKLNLRTIYIFGIWCMVIIAGANIWGLVLKILAGNSPWIIIVSFGGILLNFMFMVLFWYFAYKMPQQQEIPEDLKADENLKELFKNG